MFWKLSLAIIVAFGVSAAQQPGPILSLENAQGTVVDRLWLFIHQGGFRFTAGEETDRRTDVNFEDQSVLYYREGGKKNELKLSCRLTFENLPPGAGSINKEHTISRLALVCDITDSEEKEESFDVSAATMVLGIEDQEEETFEPWVYRGLKCTPHIRFSALKDLPGEDYSFTLAGFWISFDAVE
jgi:hypothetical protein